MLVANLSAHLHFETFGLHNCRRMRGSFFLAVIKQIAYCWYACLPVFQLSLLTSLCLCCHANQVYIRLQGNLTLLPSLHHRIVWFWSPGHATSATSPSSGRSPPRTGTRWSQATRSTSTALWKQCWALTRWATPSPRASGARNTPSKSR